MENYDHVRTTVFLTNGQSRRPILFPLFPKSWTNSKELNILSSLMFNGDIITSESGKVMNGRPHLRQIKDYLNPQSCSLAMCNPPATFQSMMDSIFIEEIEEGVTIVYMDDILIYATTPELINFHNKVNTSV